MSELSITHLKEDLYKFEAKGCPLKYFVIWENNQSPKPENWFKVNPIGKNYYTMTKHIKNTDSIHFHVYNGNTSEYFRGKYFLSPERKNNFDDNNCNQKEKDYLIRIKKMELKYQMKLQKMKIKNELEKLKIEEEKRKIEEHKNYIKDVNNEIKNMENDLVNNYQIKINQKILNNLYEQYKFLDVNQMIPKNEISQFIDKKLQNILETIVKSMLIQSKHFNILVLGREGVGKSTLINSILKLDEYDKEKENFGLKTLKEFNEYTSNERPGLRLIDSLGIEIYKDNTKEVINSVTEYIENASKLGDSDKLVHCIWYCIDSNSSRYEKKEEGIFMKLKNIVELKKIPIIFVLTKSYDEEEYSKMVQYLNKIGINDIIPLLAKTKILKINNQIYEIKQKNLEQLINLSFDRCKNSCYISFKESLKEKIYQNIIKYFNESNNRINNSFQNIKIKTSDDYENSQKMINSIINSLNQIISEYIGNQDSNEI